MSNFKKNLILIILFSNNLAISQTQNFNGVVIDKDNGKPLVGVNIIGRDFGTSSNEFGEFSLEAEKNSTALFKYVGFDSVELKLDKNMSVFLNRKPIAFNEIDVVATRAIDKVSPVSFSNLTSDEIKMRYSAEDVPMILSSEPGVWAYSESGNGTGYYYVTIRGFDQSRIAVFFDGVPLNDNESHQVYWVDHGDLLSDVDNIQIQRGIGNNLYGSSAFGGSINVNTKIASDEREISGTIGSGDWNTQKIRASYRSGSDLGDDISLAVRLSDIKSDGYRQFHDSYQRGFSLGLEHRGKAINQFRALIGYENTDLLWDGIYFNDIEENDIPINYVGIALLVLIIPVFMLYLDIVSSVGIAALLSIVMMVFGFLFSAVAAYMAGVVGSSNNPVSGVTIATILFASLLLLALLGTGSGVGAASAVMVGAVVCCAAAIGGDNLQDLKAGNILGATPYKQQIMQIIGTVSSAVVLGLVLDILHTAYTIGSPTLSAPQATLMKSVSDGVFTGNLPWNFVFIGGIIAIILILIDLRQEKIGSDFRVPVLAVAVGIYLPITLTVPIFIGGMVNHLGKKAGGSAKSEKNGLLMSSGFITGEALCGIGIAVPVFLTGVKDWWPTFYEKSDMIGVFVFISIIFWLFKTVSNKD